MKIAFILLSFFGHTAPQTIVVNTEKVAPVELSEKLLFPARIVAKTQVSTIAEIDGNIQTLYVKMGDRVRRGQKLAALKNSDPVFTYQPVEIQAPISGAVSTIEFSEGARVTKGQKILTLIDPHNLVLQMEITAKEMAQLHVNDKGTFKLPGEVEEIPVVLNSIGPAVDPATGTATVELKVENPKLLKALRPGQIGKASFKVDVRQGIEVLENSLVYRGKDPFVRIVLEGKAKFLPVKIGKTRFGKVEILEGLKKEDELIVRSNNFVADGEAVTLEKPAEEKKEVK